MPPIRITKQRRTSGADRRGPEEPQLLLDPRDPDIVRVKRLQRRPATRMPSRSSSPRSALS
jgi:hypothetical protein